MIKYFKKELIALLIFCCSTTVFALDKAGYKSAIEEVKNMRKGNSDFKLTEKEINGRECKLIEQNKMTDALKIFKLNIYLYPWSANAFDSLAKTYAQLDDTEPAIKNYEQSLKLNPQNKNTEQQLKNSGQINKVSRKKSVASERIKFN